MLAEPSACWVVAEAFDIGSLCLVFNLLWCVNKKYKSTYESEFDTMPVWNAVPGLLVLAMCVHGHMNKSFFYDTVWTFSMHLDTIAMLPQFWLFVKKGGAVRNRRNQGVFETFARFGRSLSCVFRALRAWPAGARLRRRWVTSWRASWLRARCLSRSGSTATRR